MSRPCSCARSTPFWRATGCCARRAPTAARPRSSPSSRAPGSISSATRIRARASSAKARSRGRPAASRWRWRKLDDEGKLWTFDPAASFTLEATLAANGAAEAEFIVGRSDNAVWASELDRPAPRPRRRLPEPDLQTRLYETRAVEPSPALPSRWPFAFSADGSRCILTHRTPRPWAHVMANELGMATMVSQRRRDLLRLRQRPPERPDRFPLRQRDRRRSRARSSIFAISTRGETDATGFAPFQREDASYRRRPMSRASRPSSRPAAT